jgi:predicted DNA-binding protein YlxM (UPF0122 family)
MVKISTILSDELIVEGKQYLSLVDIAREYELTKNSVYARYRRGKRCDDLVPEKKRKNYTPPKPEPIRYKLHVDGKGFKSESEACRYFNVPFVTYRTRKYQGYSTEQCLGLKAIPDKRKISQNKNSRNAQPIRLNVYGKMYKSYASLAREYDLKDYVLRQRITKYGYSPEEAVSMDGKAKKIIVVGKEYKSIVEFAEAFEKTAEQVISLVNRGRTYEEIAGIEIANTVNTFVYEGKKYKSFKDFCEKNSYSYSTIQSRLGRGYSLKEALNKSFSLEGRYTLKKLQRDSELANKPSFVYFVKLFFKDNVFHKVGITTNNVNMRFKGQNLDLIYEKKLPLIDCYKLEQKILKKYKNQTKPEGISRDFDGFSEILDLNDDQVADIIGMLKN